MKRLIAITASLICCMGNEMPAQAFWVDECAIVRDQYAMTQKMTAATGAEMDRQSAANGSSYRYTDDMLAQNRAMYEAMLSHKNCK